MELLGNYGSDSEDDDMPPTSSKAPQNGGQRQAHGAIPSNTTAASAQQWSKLPPSETTSSKASMPLSRKVISFQVPLSLAALKDDSDDEKEESAVRAAKRLKAAGGGMAKSKLTDFLPPPKNEDITQALGAGSAGGNRGRGLGAASGGGMSGRKPKGFYDDDEDEDDPIVAAGYGDGGALAVGLSNESFRSSADAEGADAGAYEAGQYGGGSGVSGAAGAPSSSVQHPSAAYAVQQAGPSSSSQQARLPNRAEFDLPADLAGVDFKEINQQQLRYQDPSRKEAKNGVRAALGADFENDLRAQATKHLGSKQARSKHQIGTLFANAKINEIELLEGKARSMKTKRETQAKYGW